MSKITISKSLLNSLKGNPLFAEAIEKSSRPVKYIYRKPSGKSGKGQSKWLYFYLEDLIKRPVAKLQEFFGVTEKQLDESFEKNNIKKDFGADKKTWAQHIAEYLSHRAIWDKRFADKAIRDRNEKPIKMAEAKKMPVTKDTETPEAESDQLDLFSSEVKEKQEWKANPSLMRKVWSLYTGKAILAKEKQEKAAKKETLTIEEAGLSAAAKGAYKNAIINEDDPRNPKNQEKYRSAYKTMLESLDLDAALKLRSLLPTKTKLVFHGVEIDDKNYPNITNDLLDKQIEKLEAAGDTEKTFESGEFSMNLKKVGNNWNISTSVNNKPDEFFTFKTKKAAEEFFERYKQTKEEWTEETKQLKETVSQIASNYNYFYNSEDENNIAGYRDAIKAYDDYAKLKEFNDYVGKLVKVRGDYFSSDREIAALMFALDANGMLDKFDELMPKESEAEKHEKQKSIKEIVIDKIDDFIDDGAYSTFDDFYNHLKFLANDLSDRRSIDCRDLLGYKKEFLQSSYEEYLNRHNAMLGNQNAKKDFIEEDPYYGNRGPHNATGADKVKILKKIRESGSIGYDLLSTLYNDDREFYDQLSLKVGQENLEDFVNSVYKNDYLSNEEIVKLGDKTKAEYKEHFSKWTDKEDLKNRVIEGLKNELKNPLPIGISDEVIRYNTELKDRILTNAKLQAAQERLKELENGIKAVKPTELEAWEKIDARTNMSNFLKETPSTYYDLLNYAIKNDVDKEKKELYAAQDKAKEEGNTRLVAEIEEKLRPVQGKSIENSSINFPKWGLPYGNLKALLDIYKVSDSVDEFTSKVIKNKNFVAKMGMENLGIKDTFSNYEKYLAKLFKDFTDFITYKPQKSVNEAQETPKETVSDYVDKKRADDLIATLLESKNYDKIRKEAENPNLRNRIANQLYNEISYMNTDYGRNTIDYVINKVKELAKLDDKELRKIYLKEYKSVYENNLENGLDLDNSNYKNEYENLYSNVTTEEIEAELQREKSHILMNKKFANPFAVETLQEILNKRKETVSLNSDNERVVNDEYNYTKIAYKDNSKLELQSALGQSEHDWEEYNDQIIQIENELKNPSDPGMFATPESIAENERAMKANLDKLKMYRSQEEGKQKALEEMIELKADEKITREDILRIIDGKIDSYKKIGDRDARIGWEKTKERFENGTESDFERKIFGFHPEETEQEKHDNRSAAMMGNQNARKYGLSDFEFNKLMDHFKNTFSDWKIENGVLKLNKDYTDIYGTTKEGTVLDNEAVAGAIVSRIIENGRKLNKYERLNLKDVAAKAGYTSVNEFMKNFLNDFIADNPNYENNAIINDVGENANDNTRIESTGISGSNSDIRTEREQSSVENVPGKQYGSNESEHGKLTSDIGGRSENAESVTSGIYGDGSGRLTKGQARKIREKCKEILATKKDSEMTDADKAILSQYVGAGGIDEKDATNSGVLYEFYTPRNVISKVWEIVDKYNPNQNKKVIEPSSGIGRFAEGRNEQFSMFEFEPDSARIAKILHPNAEVIQGEFQANFMRNGKFTKDFEKFDVAVGNPPYGAYEGRSKGKGEGKEYKRFESYFMGRTLDTLKDGAIMAMVVPSGFLDGKSTYGKDLEIISKKAKLLEAWRLPNGSFDSTDVGTDIVVFKKGDGGSAEDLMNYFKNNPSHICGEEATRIGRFGEEKYIKTKNGETFESAIENIDAHAVEAEKMIAQAEKEIKVDVKEKAEYTKVPDDLKFGAEIETPNGKGKINGFIKDKTTKKNKAYYVMVNGKSETVYVTPEEEHEHRSEAMKGNDNAKGKRGSKKATEKNTDVFVPSTGKNMTAEEFNKKYAKSFDPKDLPIWKYTDNNGNVDESKLSDSELNYVKNSDHYVFDNGKYVNIVNFASGNIREKLDNLDEKDPQYEVKKSLLNAAMPKERAIGQFTLSPIDEWTENYKTSDGIGLVEAFFAWAYNGNGTYLASDSPISLEEIPAEISFREIEKYVRGIAAGERGDDGRTKYRIKEKRREAAERLFNRFLKEGLALEDQKSLTKDWNDKFNTYVNPDYKKIPVFISGMNENKGTKEFTLTEQQLKGIAQLTNKGTGLLAYDVGVGKTITGIAATVAQIQSGRSKRPLICVPKSVYKNWIESIHQHFPDIKVNELGNMSKDYLSEDFVPEDGSITVCTYQALEKIGFNQENEDKIAEDIEYGTMMGNRDGESKRSAASRQEKTETMIGSMVSTKGDEVMWERFGFDHITVDEVHNFRNLFRAPRKIKLSEDEEAENKVNEFSALGSGGDPSKIAQKLFCITQLIQRENEGRNTFLLSATPFQNSPVEIYSILSYMARDKLKELGIYSLENFVKKFADIKSEYVVKANKIEEKMVMKNFNNLSALQNILTEFMDKVDGEEAGVARPYKRTHAPELELNDLQKAIMKECNDYIEEQEKKAKDDRDPGYMFRAMNAMRNCALSPALVDESFIPSGYTKPSMNQIVESSPKLKFVCDSVIAQYKKAPKNGQIIYMPSGVDQFPQVKDYLVKHGIQKNAVALMKGAASSEKQLDAREAVMNEFNDVEGECKVIIGSSTIKEGVSLNGNSTVIYNTQLDWNPTDAQQVEGRIWRQGNKQGVTHIVYPLMHDSIDSMIYQKYDEKGSRLNALFSYKGDNLNVEDINPEELKFGLIKDPAKRAKMQVTQFEEEAKANEKLYAQMIDVLHKQADVAFEEEPAESVKNKYVHNYEENLNADIETSQIAVNSYKEMLKNIKKAYKGKEDSFSMSDIRNGKFDVGNRTLKWEYSSFSGKQGLQSLLEKIERYTKDEEVTLKSYQRQKADYHKEIDRAIKRQESTKAALKAKGINNPDDVKTKINALVKLMDKAKDDQQNAQEKYQKYYDEAVKDIEENKKTMPPLDEQIKQNVDSIMNDLVPFAEVKDQIQAELAKKKKELNKSIFFIKDGRFLIRKLR